ncbi:MAG TPA: nuclear transport factor 2 family protein, partial [Gracilimonas sp.]|nr:nuclear transport factor 2 family protein [Gracilimonas sp.]
MEELSPKLLIEQWVDVFNQGNAKALSEFYAKDVVNHQVADDPVEGRQAIRKRFEKEFSTADMTCIIEN